MPFLGLVTIAGSAAWLLYSLPIDQLANGSDEPPAMLIEAADGQVLSRRGQFKLADAAPSEFPDHLVAAVISIEDRRFRSHPGIDVVSIVRALYRNAAAGKVVQGGSTITQQLARSMLGDDERSLGRKLREGSLAMWLEMRLSKDEILSRYLNTVYMGAGVRGVPAAAERYFSKQLSALTLPEAAMLAGMIQAPSALNPLYDLGAARRRASLVLETMVETESIDRPTAEAAKASPATPAPSQAAARDSTWFADWVYQEAANLSGGSRERLLVRTTLVPELQKLAERAIRDGLAGPGSRAGATQAALVALRPDGAVLAMVGGRDYRENQFNRAAQAMRQPGSAFKPFVYFAALRAGISPVDVVEDAPLDVDGWRPENFGGNYHGLVTVAEAFARSLNTATVRLALTVGLKEVIAAARDLGLDSPLVETPSLALGTSEVSLLDLTGAYASIRAGSMPIQPWGISAFGIEGQRSLVSARPAAVNQRPIGQHRDQLVALLQSVVDRGTGRGAALQGFAAGKTGTSQNYRDAWFVGFNEALVVGVWVGNDDNAPMDHVTGGSVPALIWKNFVTAATPLAENPALLVSQNDDPEVQPAAGQCDHRACSAKYRSFRASDCSFQPFGGGPRQFCSPAGTRTRIAGDESSISLALAEPGVPDGEFAEPAHGDCNVGECAATYNSFRESDCTYQPFSGGPRRLCRLGAAWNGDVRPAFDRPFEALGQEAAVAGPPSCSVSACAGFYASFRASDCSYQPYDGGPRRFCEK